MQSNNPKFTNKLIESSSPYLLQHAHNPVNWQEWGEASLAQAKIENKPLLISIGYSACHWCHVMERESFENEAIAAIMNANFVCIKVDREERPDIDQIYMDAVQLMTNRGGWPLNCFALPDGKPFFGGTYFAPENWQNVLEKIAEAYKTDYPKIVEYAENLTAGVQQSDLAQLQQQENVDAAWNSIFDEALNNWKSRFDNEEGGRKGAPKFPLPNNYQFLLDYGLLNGNDEVLEHVKLTLKKMAFGGIYDQIGGGFARYAVDDLWKVPHFEKMLYDNAQLLELYSLAYSVYRDEDFKKVVFQTFDFLERELKDKNGAYYSALDADSEGIEGKYYVWQLEELRAILSIDEFRIAEVYYNLNSNGYWEDENYILLRMQENGDVAAQLNISESDLEIKIAHIQQKLLSIRNQREKPGLDNKILTSWNALMIKSLASAFKIFGDDKFLNAAVKNANFILDKMKKEDGGLWHIYNGNVASINAHAEDYAFAIEAFTALYEITMDEKWLGEARFLAAYTIENFFDDESGFFFFTSKKDAALIARKRAVDDNVTPAANSSLAKGLFRLGNYYENKAFLKIANHITNAVKSTFSKYPTQYTNYGQQMLSYAYPFYEVAIVGENSQALMLELSKQYQPNIIFALSKSESQLPLIQQRYQAGKTLIYVCVEKTCQRPVATARDAFALLKFKNS